MIRLLNLLFYFLLKLAVLPPMNAHPNTTSIVHIVTLAALSANPPVSHACLLEFVLAVYLAFSTMENAVVLVPLVFTRVKTLVKYVIATALDAEAQLIFVLVALKTNTCRGLSVWMGAVINIILTAAHSHVSHV